MLNIVLYLLMPNNFLKLLIFFLNIEIFSSLLIVIIDVNRIIEKVNKLMIVFTKFYVNIS